MISSEAVVLDQALLKPPFYYNSTGKCAESFKAVPMARVDGNICLKIRASSFSFVNSHLHPSKLNLGRPWRTWKRLLFLILSSLLHCPAVPLDLCKPLRLLGISWFHGKSKNQCLHSLLYDSCINSNLFYESLVRISMLFLAGCRLVDKNLRHVSNSGAQRDTHRWIDNSSPRSCSSH